jgi:GNAT superfamily N-acetyltransferase
MAIVYRQAREDELARAQELIVTSINDLTRRHGFGPMASSRPPHFQTFSLRDDPDGLWTAEENGDIAGCAFGWACGDLWFLAELFVAPGQQGRGIGNELLSRALKHAQARGATTRALITFAFNTVSQALYIRNGMFPQTPVYLFSAPSESAVTDSQSPLETVALQSADLDDVTAVDTRTLGVSREKHHRFLIADGTMVGVLFRASGATIGYAYVNPDGHVGPLAVTQPEYMAPAFTAALALAAGRGSKQISAFIPGANEAALAAAVRRGMRIAFPMLLMSSKPFGDWSCYLPRNPGFM